MQINLYQKGFCLPTISAKLLSSDPTKIDVEGYANMDVGMRLDKDKIIFVSNSNVGVWNAEKPITKAELFSDGTKGYYAHFKLNIGRTVAGDVCSITLKTYNSSSRIASIWDKDKVQYRSNSYELIYKVLDNPSDAKDITKFVMPIFVYETDTVLADYKDSTISTLVAYGVTFSRNSDGNFSFTWNVTNPGGVSVTLANSLDTSFSFNDESSIEREFINYTGLEMLPFFVTQIAENPKSDVARAITDLKEAIDYTMQQLDIASQNFISR